jgi:glyoxylate/hydroxypyruvate reductase
MKIYVYTELEAELQNRMKEELSDHDVSFRGESPSEEKFREAEMLLGNPPRKWLTESKSLRFWQLDSAGFEQYSDVAVTFPVANMGDFFAVKCAETIVGGILGFYRNIHRLVQLQKEKKWIGKPLRYSMDLLSGKKVIILGAGTIAISIKKMLSGFECDVQLSARTNPSADILSTEVLMERLGDVDLVVNTLPGTAKHFANTSFFHAMRQGSVYASVGRGNTTDEAALIEALQSQRLVGAILDVTETEPLPLMSPLWSMENVILTQHTAGGYRFEDEGKVELFITNVNRIMSGQSILNEIDLRSGY